MINFSNLEDMNIEDIVTGIVDTTNKGHKISPELHENMIKLLDHALAIGVETKDDTLLQRADVLLSLLSKVKV